MDIHNQVPVLVLHILECHISEDTSVVEQDIDAAIGFNRGLDDLLAIGDAVVVCDSFAACGFDLIDDYIGSLRSLACGFGGVVRKGGCLLSSSFLHP